MNGKPVVVLCSHARCAPGALDVGRLSALIAKSDVIDGPVILEEPCRVPPAAMTSIRKRKVIFAGCPLLREGGFYEQMARKLVIGVSDYVAVDLRADILDRYEGTTGIREENARVLLESAGQILAGTQPVVAHGVAAHRRVLVFGSGMSGMSAALGLASEGISVDVLETKGHSVSPGCLGAIFRSPDGMERLRERARRDERILFLPPDGLRNPTPLEGGFLFVSAEGDSREYGSIVFAPERQEEPSEDSGAFTLTQLYGYMQTGKAVGGQVAFLLDRDGETEPEVFRDVLCAAAHLTQRLQAEVVVLAKNAQVSLSDAQELYDECRQVGVLFIRYRGAVSLTSGYGDFVIRGIDDHTNAQFLVEKPKILVIPGRIGLADEARAFSRALALRLTSDRFTQPDSLWRSANETNRAGVFAVGAARGHMAAEGIDDDVASLASAVRARLAPGGIPIEEHIAVVNKDKCAYCLTCVRLCPFGAMEKDLVERVAKVCATACKACGVCAAECPAQAIELRNRGAAQVRAAVHMLVR
jgi:heterodisulfide reductase subunit A